MIKREKVKKARKANLARLRQARGRGRYRFCAYIDLYPIDLSSYESMIASVNKTPVGQLLNKVNHLYDP